MFDEKAYSSICFHFCAPKTFKSLKLFKKNFMFQDFVREMGIVKKAIISKRRHKSV